MATNSINATFKGGWHFAVDVKGHTIDIDNTKENGGKDTGPTPKIFMLLSLAGCTGFDVVSILTKMKVNFSDFSIKVDGDLTSEMPTTYNNVSIHYTIKMKKGDRPKMERAVKLSEEKYCGVSRMFQAFSKVHFDISYL